MNSNKLYQLLEMCQPFHEQYKQAKTLADAKYAQDTMAEKQQYDRIRETAFSNYQQARRLAVTEEQVEAAEEVYSRTVDEAWGQYKKDTATAQAEQAKAYNTAQLILNAAIKETTRKWKSEQT